MKHFRTIALPIVFVCFAGCSTPEERAHEAQEKVHNERLQLVDDYKACLKEAGDDQSKTEFCDRYLKAAEALK